jgi:hypothetical protein
MKATQVAAGNIHPAVALSALYVRTVLGDLGLNGRERLAGTMAANRSPRISRGACRGPLLVVVARVARRLREPVDPGRTTTDLRHMWFSRRQLFSVCTRSCERNVDLDESFIF